MLPFAVAVLLTAAPADPLADLFKPTGPVPKLRITVDPDAIKVLKKEPRKYIRCSVRVSGAETVSDIGIHLKGAAGSYRDWDDKPALTLNADKFAKQQTFRGLDKFHLNNSAQDNSYLNEILCAEMALAAGLPAARGTHVLLQLNGRNVGLYVLKEGFDKAWLARHFADPNGNLYDGGFLADIDAPLQLDSGPGNDRKDLQSLLKACRVKDADKRYEAVEKLLDVDRFMTIAALQMIACDWDGYVRNRNNYRLYFHPKDGKAVFLPHGMDQEFEGERLGEGLIGWGGIVSRAVLDTPKGRAKYLARLKEFTEKYFVVEKLHKRIDELAARVIMALTATDKGAADWYKNEVKAAKDRIKQRSEFVKRELPKLK